MSAEARPTDAGLPPLVIGLTGPIGCGKSNIGRVLGELGGTVIDADVLARRATDRGAPTLVHIRDRFGPNVFDEDGALDRGALAAVVFGDDAALADLESIVHPEVRTLLDAELESAASERVPFVVVEAIKLVEGGLAELCDEVWLVECSEATQRSRLAHRGATASDIDRRVGAQGPGLAARLAAQLSDRPGVRRLNTEGPLEETRAKVEDALADALENFLAED